MKVVGRGGLKAAEGEWAINLRVPPEFYWTVCNLQEFKLRKGKWARNQPAKIKGEEYGGEVNCGRQR